MEAPETMHCTRCHTEIPADGPEGLCPKCLISVGLGEPEIVVTDAGEPAPPPPTPEELQPHFAQYEIVRLVGRGGMGAVYEARQRGLQRKVALKILSTPTRADPTFEERFVREAQALARLSHENIVAVYDAGRAGPHFYLAMEYVDGPNLRQAERATRIEPAQALALVTQICAALDYAHRNGVVHRDIKPENVLLTRDGQVKLADFGLAKMLDRSARGLSLTRMSQTMGTPHYMAPEQIERPKDVDHRADIYSLGVVFYELLTGELPLGRFPLPSHKVVIDVRLDDIVIRTLEKEPERRYQAASEVRTAVQDVASSPETATPTRVESPAVRAPRTGRRLLVGALAVVALIGAVAFAAVLLSRTRALTPEALRAADMASRAGRMRMRELVVDALERIPDAAAVDARTQVLRELAPTIATYPLEQREELVRAALELAGTGSRDDPLRRYEQHVVATATKLDLLGPTEIAAVRLAPDYGLVTRLRDELAIELLERMSGRLPAASIDRVVRERLPFDRGPVEVRIRREGAWIVEIRTPHTVSTETFDEDLPRLYRELVDRFRSSSVKGAARPNAEELPRVADASAPTYSTLRALAPIRQIALDAADRADRSRAIDIALALPQFGLRADPLVAYRAHESERTTLLPLAGGSEVAAARIDFDPDVVGRLRQELRRALISSFGPGIAAEDVEWLVREHMPFETGPVEIRIEHDADGWTVREKAAGFEDDVDRFDGSLPRGLQRIVERASAAASQGMPTELPDFAKVAPTGGRPQPAGGGPSGAPSVPAAWAAARGVIAHTGRAIVEEYLRLEADHVGAMPNRDGDVAHMRIAAFPAARATLAAALWQELIENLAAEDLEALRGDGFDFAVLPFGDDDYEVSIGGDETGWTCASSRRSGGQVSSFGFPDLPEPYARLLALRRDRR